MLAGENVVDLGRVTSIARRYRLILDRENIAPKELFEELRGTGVFGINIPREYGGLGGGMKDLVRTLIEISKESPSIAHIIFVHSMTAHFLKSLGRDALKENILPKAADGDKILALSFTEPESGTDLASIRTTAVKSKDYYLVRGEKIFSTNATYADAFLTLVRTGSLEEGSKALTLILVEKGEGVKVGEPIELIGFRGTGLARVLFEDARAPLDNVLGVENEGFKPAVEGLAVGRVPFSAIAVGIAEGALGEALKWSLERKSFGKPIFENQGVSFPLADIKARLEAIKTFIFRLAEDVDKGLEVGVGASIAKLLSAELAVEASRTCVQIMGGWGLLSDSKISMLYRDAKATEIAEGTNEVQKMIIARHLLREYKKLLS